MWPKPQESLKARHRFHPTYERGDKMASPRLIGRNETEPGQAPRLTRHLGRVRQDACVAWPRCDGKQTDGIRHLVS